MRMLPALILSLAVAISSETSAEEIVAKAFQDNAGARQELARARAMFRKGQLAAARRTLAEARTQFPSLSSPGVMLALFHLDEGDRRAAERALDEAVIDNPADFEAFVVQGELALRDDRLTMADLSYHRAEELLKRESKDSDANHRGLLIRIHAGLASTAEAGGQLAEAKARLTEWIQMDERNPIALGSLGRVNFLLKDYAGARDAFERLTTVEKQAPPADIALGRLYLDHNMHQEAKSAAAAALDAHPDDLRIQLTVAEWMLALGDSEAAQRHVEAVLARAATSVPARLLAARIARHTGRTADAVQELDRLSKEFPDAFIVRNELLLAQAESNDAAALAQTLNAAKAAFDTQKSAAEGIRLDASITYAWLLFRNDQQKEAAAIVEDLPRGASLSSESAYYVARILFGAEKPEPALRMLKLALEKRLSFPHADEARALYQQHDGQARADAANLN